MRSRRGFTIIEVTVTLLVVGIMTTFAWATYTYVSRTTQAQPVRNALETLSTVQEREWRTTGMYRDEVAWLNSLDLGVAFTNDHSTGPDVVSIWASDDIDNPILGMAAYVTATGVCLTHVQTKPGPTYEITRDEKEVSPTQCTGEGAAAQ